MGNNNRTRATIPKIKENWRMTERTESTNENAWVYFELRKKMFWDKAANGEKQQCHV